MLEAAGQSLVGTLVSLATEILRPTLAERLPAAFRQLQSSAPPSWRPLQWAHPTRRGAMGCTEHVVKALEA